MIVFLIAPVLLGICLGIGAYLFFTACGPFHKINWLDEAEITRTPYGRFYPHVQEADQFLRSHHAQDLYVQSHDGLKLHATYVPAENPQGTVLLVHGYHSGIYTDFGLVMAMYHEMGMNVLLPDQRCHGESEGRYVTFGVLESRDMLQWIRYHNEHIGPYPMEISGLSMGASTVMYLADQELPDNVKIFISDCGFTSPAQIIGKVFKDTMHIPAGPILWAADIFARFFAGFSLYEKNSVKILAANTHPILFVHGLADDFVPADMTRRSFEACAGEKKLLLVEGAAHGVSYLVAKDAYLAQVHQLLDHYIPR